MNDPTEKPRLLSCAYFVGAMLCAPMLYVLSIGPVAGLSAVGIIPANISLQLDQTFYAPLVWVLESSPTICNVLARYESLFVP